MLADNWPGLYLDGQAATVHGLLARFPAEAADAELAAVAAGDELARGSLEAAERYLGLAERASASVADGRAGQAQLLLGMVRLLLAHQRGNRPVAEEARRLQALAEAPEAAQAGLGEELRALALISLGSTEFWGSQARAQLAAGHQVSGRDGLLRAATYWRSAEFFTRDRDPDPRGRAAYEAGVGCFAGAAALMSPAVTPVAIPFEGTALPGYLYAPPGGGPAATLIMHGGFDGWAEELHHCGALAAQERGYTVLTFDGPGQGRPCYEGLVFRPDWESVVSPVIDWAAARPEVDPGRIALAGYSMGGGLAPRAAAFDPRIAALICIDGIYDIGQSCTGKLGLGADAERRLTAGSDPELDALAQQVMATSPQVRWACRQGMWSFGVGTPRAFLAASLAYTLRGGVAEKIPCPVFVGRGESDVFFLGQPEELMQHLTAPAALASFTDAEGAGAHCQAGAQRLLCARMLDWLDDTLPGSGAGPASSRP